jgi:transcriptional regulator with XRE-family HTH domain
MILEQREGTAAQLGLDGRTLGYMARRGQAEIIGKTRGRRQMVHVWRVFPQQLPPTVQAHLRQMRLDACVTIEDLADRSGVGHATIKSYERSDNMPRTMTVYAVLDGLGSRFAELTARLYDKPAPERLPTGQLFPLHDAVLAAFAFIAPCYRLPWKVLTEGYNVQYWRIDGFCHEAGIDPVELWREVDSRLRWTR